MIIYHKILYFITVVLIIRGIYAIRFERTIEAVGYPYYKIIFSLGTCKGKVLFTDNKIWGSVRLNRIFDIYYKSVDGHSISRVEIKLVVNNTDCITNSDTGVGRHDFSAVLVLPTNVGIIFYSLTIYSCSITRESKRSEETLDGVLEDVEPELLMCN
ncbi:hypothetical protein ABMA28_007628 [Loxostege sticticalis]|uniref:Uncharacterized protein n=1 Tax=Loxostege sticticalis TaxID=481309 RepID=A0ABD0SIZ9_LOXSC